MALTIHKSAPSVASSPAPKVSKSWMKRGDASAQMMAEEESRIKDLKNKSFRFWLNKGEEARITFIDGTLTPKGLLDILTYREHHIQLNGKWGNMYPCVAENESCPLCVAGNNPSIVGLLTVIDHREVIGKKAKYPYTRKLFVAKLGTLKILQQLASKRGGLVNCTFDVSRQGEQAPNVGDVFDFVERRDPKTSKTAFVRKDAQTGKVITLYTPIDYSTEIRYYTASELKALGFGGGIGGESALQDNVDGGDADDGKDL